MTTTQPHYTVALTESLQQISIEAVQLFGQLTPEQLNWKPTHDKWSIGQCLDHIMVTNTSYYPEFERILNGNPFTNIWGKIPFLPTLFGNMLLKSVNPNSARPLKTTTAFTPTSSALPGTIVTDFTLQQQRTVDYYNRLQQVQQHKKIMLTSPPANFITYSLNDALQIIALHAQRHLQQAKRVMQMPGFPAQTS